MISFVMEKCLIVPVCVCECVCVCARNSEKTLFC